MNAEITEAMIEAAASVFFATTADQIGKAGSSYSALPEASKDKVRICARAALEAALSANTVVPDGQVTEAQRLATLGREHLMAGNVDDALTAFNRIAALASTVAPDHCGWVETEQAPYAVAPDDTDPSGIVVMDDDAETRETLIAKCADMLNVRRAIAHLKDGWQLDDDQRADVIRWLERLVSKPDGLIAALRDARMFVDLVAMRAQREGEQIQETEARDCLAGIDAALLPQAKGDA